MRKVYNWMLAFVVTLLAVPVIHAQNIVAEYDFNGSAKDKTSFANHAAVHGANLTQDRFGIANRAFLFDGVSSSVTAPNAAQLNTPTTTVSFWVRVDELPDQGEAFLLSFGGWQERWKISLPSHGKPVWTTNHTNGISDMDSGDANFLQVDRWTHVVAVHDGTKDYIYIDGALAAEKDVAGDLNNSTYPLGIGYNPIDNANYFNGAIDDVRIYDGALDAAAVAALFAEQSTEPSIPDGIVASYLFDGDLRDASGYDNHATGTDVTYVPDRFGFGRQAVYFNGTTTEVTATNSDHLNSPWTTVSFMINPASLPDNGEVFIASFGGWQERWKISLPSHGKLVWTTNHVNGISDLDAGDGNELPTNTWTHVVLVHSTSKDLIYINGELAAEKNVIGALNSTSYPLGIGYNPVDGGNWFHGAIDHFQVFNESLSAGQIVSLYSQLLIPSVDPGPGPLVAHFPMSGDLDDATVYDNDGNDKETNFTTDRFGYANNALSLDGTAGVTVANSPVYNTDYTTVSFWVNLNELPGNGEVYLMSHGGWQERWKISLPSHGKPVWTTHHTAGISDMDSGDGNALVPGTWTHVVMSHGPAQDKIYINGALVASKDVGNALLATSHPLGIGWNPIDGDNFVNGAIDEVQLYDRDLTDQEVADLYAEQSAPPIFVGNVAAEYPLNGNAQDISAHHNHGKVTGATPGKNRFDQANHAMVFDGVDDEITVSNSPQLNSPFPSVSFWVNINNLPGNGEAYLMSFGGWQERWKISLPTHGKPVWTTNNSSGISDMDSGDGNELSEGQWYHLVFVHNGIHDQIYINGDLAAEKLVSGEMNSTTHDLYIGYNGIDGGSYFDGSIDDIRLYNLPLSAGEVLALYLEQSQAPIVTDTEAPCAPMNLNGVVEFTNVTLTWLPAEDNVGVESYNVYVNGELVETTSETSAEPKGLAPLTEYEFGVSAVDSSGNESLRTTINLTTGQDETPDTEAPSTPTNLAVTAGANSAVFSWDFSTDNVAVAGYVTFVDGNYVDSLDATQNSVFVGGLDASTLYTFEVYAFDLSGNDSEIAFITESTTDPIDTGEEGLVAHYKFEGNANDATPYNNHGVIGGNPTFETVTNRPNASGMAIVFDGDADSVLAPNAVQLISDYATVSFWIRVDGQNLADAEAYVLDFGHWNERWKISLPQHLKPVWTTNSKNAQFDHFISDMDSGDGNELVIGFWFYVTMVHDGTDDIIYMDGVEVNRKPASGKLNPTDNPFGMGNNPVEGGQYFEGALDEVKIYNKALTAEEIEKLYETGTTSIRDLQNELNKYVRVVYPNPAKDQLLIQHGFESQNLLLRIFDELGRQVDAVKVDASQMQSGQINVNVAKLHSGNYSLNFVLDGKVTGSVPFAKQ